jgi:hypothetical protein
MPKTFRVVYINRDKSETVAYCFGHPLVGFSETAAKAYRNRLLIESGTAATDEWGHFEVRQES